MKYETRNILLEIFGYAGLAGGVLYLVEKLIKLLF